MPEQPYKKTILAAISEALGSVGFRKSGMHFSRPVNDVVHLISLQSSTGSTASTVKVTLNIGVWLPILAEDGQKPDIWSSHWSQRIGFLMPKNNDHWWVVSSEQEAVVAATEIREAIQSCVLPRLDDLATSKSMAQLWQSGISDGLTEFQAKRFLEKLNRKTKQA